jgi:16S rRNA (guanine527-N7)-methyltransferase
MNENARAILVNGLSEFGFPLPDNKITEFCAFADELRKWNRKINLTAIRDDEGVAEKHFLDSLALLKVIMSQGRLLDIGSGAGFPAIPLKIAMDNLDVLSVDSVEKKIFFQRHIARIIGLKGFEAVHARAEELQGRFEGCFDWVVSRAFSDIPTFAKIALPFLSPGGKIIAMKGKSGGIELADSTLILEKLGAVVSDMIEFHLPFCGDARSLLVIKRT